MRKKQRMTVSVILHGNKIQVGLQEETAGCVQIQTHIPEFAYIKTPVTRLPSERNAS